MTMLPCLRQELTLSAGPAGPDGAPTWMLHDPAANRFFQLAWPAFELLARWSLGDPAAIAASVKRETTLDVSTDDVDLLLRMLARENLLVAGSAAATARLDERARAERPSHAMWLLKHYLMVRVPLWRPMPFLQRFARLASFAYQPAFWWLVGACAVLGLALVSRQWDEFIHTFHGYADLQGLLAVGCTLALAKVLHEFGHAFTAQRYGCRVPTMGVALLVMVPVLYTDTTEAWKVPQRSRRLAIGAAGMLSELALAAFSTLAWSLLPDGPLRAGAFLLATTTWIGTLAINASPFMRFDGYFLLSDWLGMPNLHDRAFALGRWWLRERLFGFGDPQPEPFAPERRRFLIAFSLATWLYRLVVFFSIALIVYHAFFKALGLVLFAVEFGWFIVRPVVREAAASWQRRGRLRWRRETLRTLVMACLVLGAIVVPWRGGVQAPAVFGPQQAQGLYAAEAGYLRTADVHDGQQVQAGQVLAVIASPDLEFRLRAAQADETLLHWEVEQQSFDERLREQGVALSKRWEAAQETVAGLQAEIAQLTLRAPFAGRVDLAEDSLAPGTWLPRGAHLVDVVGSQGVSGDAYVDEDQVQRVHAGQGVVFIADVGEMSRLSCRVLAVDKVNLGALDEESLSSTYGGPIAAERDPATRQIVPLRATWRVRLGQCDGGQVLARKLTGTATLQAGSQSYLGRGVRWLVATVQGEAGF